MRGEPVRISTCGAVAVTKGSAGLPSQCPGQALTVSAVASATGGIAGGNVITTSNK